MNEEGREDPVRIGRWSRALSWHATLREADEKQLSNSVGREWQEWYADAENRRTFDHLSRLLGDRELYRKRRRPRRAELDGDSYDLSVPIAEWRRLRVVKDARKRRSLAGNLWWWLSGGIGVTAIAVLIVLWPRFLGFGSEPSRMVVYQTEVGGLKHVHLTDGSSVVLGGRTELSVAFSARYRSVRVIEGQAWFRVAHDTHWPFIVTAGDGTITDIGTAFLVTRESDRVVVTVTEGAVEVSARQPLQPSLKLGQGFTLAPVPLAIRVTRGEQITVSDAGGVDAPKPTDTRATVAWTSGRLIFDNQPLRYVIETINRYSSRRIFVSPSAGTLRFSGIVFSDEIGDWLQSLEAIFPVTVQERGADVRIRTRNSIPATDELPPKKQ